MRNVLLASAVALAALVPASGCLPIGGCGAFAGGGDKVYQRAADMLILCENGGFVATTDAGVLEGHYHANAAGSAATGFGIRGDNGDLAFDFEDHGDGTATTPQLGDTPWTAMTLDQTALDHADLQCQDLVNRSWWTTP